MIIATSSEAASSRDYSIFNEANAFLIVSPAVAGKGWVPGSEAWRQAVLDGVLLPIELVQDDSFVIRVVVGRDLIPPEREEWVGCLSWWHDAGEIHVALPHGADWAPPQAAERTDGVVERREGDLLTFGFERTGGKWEFLRMMDALQPRFTRLPSGSILELATNTAFPAGDPPAGLQRYRGPVDGNDWLIAESFPRLCREALVEALRLSEESGSGWSVSCRSDEEASFAIAETKREWGSLLEENPIQQEATVIHMAKHDPVLAQLVAVPVFRRRFKDVWSAETGEEVTPAQSERILAAFLKNFRPPPA